VWIENGERKEEDSMKSLRIHVAALMVTLMIIVMGSALVGCGGGGTEIKQSTSSTTLGQELQDLDSAYQQGLITEKEYKDAKQKLIRQRTQ
jgi:hypothetical protein